jgi:hypothetical protein
VLSGPPLEQGCFEEKLENVAAITVNTPSGQTLVHTSHTDWVAVYDDEGYADPFDWLFGRAIAEICAGGPGPEPLATGEGRVQSSTRIDADGVFYSHDSVTATVTTADGREVHVTARWTEGVFPDFVNNGG